MKKFIRYLQTIALILVLGGWIVFPPPVSASGGMIYAQSPGHFGGFASDGLAWIVADEFEVADPRWITNITWWGGYADASTPAADSFKIWLFEDSGGQPGALLEAFPVGDTASRHMTGDWVRAPDPRLKFEGVPEFKYSYDLPVPFPVEAGRRYWISIVNTPSSDTWVWEVSGSLSYPGVQRMFESGPWAPYFDNTAFLLNGTTPNGTP